MLPLSAIGAGCRIRQPWGARAEEWDVTRAGAGLAARERMEAVKKFDELREGTITRASDEEPLFVLRSTDRLAPTVVRMWALLAKYAGVNKNKIAEAERLAESMESWGHVYGDQIPD